MTTRVSKVNREAVAAEALAMLDEEGIDALSMRRLAERLGVGTMTLYGYVRSKDELLDAAVGAAAAEFRFTEPAGELRERLRALVHAVRDVFERHPALPQLRARGPVVQPPMFRMTEPGVRMLLDAGFPPEDAARTFRLLFVYVFGAMLFGPDTPSAEDQRRARAALHLLPEDEFPAIAATAEHMAASTGGHEQFDYALELILDGIEARAKRYSAASSHQ